MSVELSNSQIYTSAAGALGEFLNLNPLVASIQQMLNEYLPAVYAIAFVMLTVGTMREFFYPETRRFLEAILRAVMLVASISFAPNVIDWCDQAAQALAEFQGAGQVNFGEWSYSIKPGQAPAITQLEQVLQSKIQGREFAIAVRESRAQIFRNLHSFLRIHWISEKMWESHGATSLGSRRIWRGKFCLRFTSYVCCSAR